MKCEITNRERLIDEYLSGALSDEEKESFDEHCFGCDVCFRELRLREEMAGLIRDEGEILFADYLEKRKTKKQGVFQTVLDKLSSFNLTYQPRWVYATASVAVIVLCVVIYRTAFLPGNGDRFSANFIPTPYLEEMITDVSRSYSLVVLSPQIGDAVEGNIQFQWEEIGEEPLSLKILNNRGEELFSSTQTNHHYIFKQNLNPGLYYWKMESDEELLFVGKFLVGKP